MSTFMSVSTLTGDKERQPLRTWMVVTLLTLVSLSVQAQKLSAQAQKVDYMREDSIKVVKLLQESRQLPSSSNLMLFFARKLCGVPYVGQTLEHNPTERLVVNVRQLDCTTYVETVLALAICSQNRRYTFDDYCRQLQHIRYADGKVSYGTRLHYFSAWIESNMRAGIVKSVNSPSAVFSRMQKLNVYYMTQHVEQYPMLVQHAEYIPEIKRMEQHLTGQTHRFIPKQAITNTQTLRNVIHNGDIIVILTSKKGLDTSHIGIAVWHNDGLHMLNASSIHHKVVEEPMTLRKYMGQHPSQIGIRIVRPCL